MIKDNYEGAKEVNDKIDANEETEAYNPNPNQTCNEITSRAQSQINISPNIQHRQDSNNSNLLNKRQDSSSSNMRNKIANVLNKPFRSNYLKT